MYVFLHICLISFSLGICILKIFPSSLGIIIVFLKAFIIVYSVIYALIIAFGIKRIFLITLNVMNLFLTMFLIALGVIMFIVLFIYALRILCCDNNDRYALNSRVDSLYNTSEENIIQDLLNDDPLNINDKTKIIETSYINNNHTIMV